MAFWDLKIDEVYDTVKGVEALKEAISKEKNIVVVNLPEFFILKELSPYLKGKKVKIYTNVPESMDSSLKKVGEIVFTCVEMVGFYKGRIVQKGDVYLKNVIFNIWWRPREIIHIGSIHFKRCVRCIKKMHEDLLITEELDRIDFTGYYEPQEGIQMIKEYIAMSKKLRLINVPCSLVEAIYPEIEGKELKIICAEDAPLARMAKDTFDVKVSGRLLDSFSIYKGKRVRTGAVATDHGFFGVDFEGDKIMGIRAVLWPRCGQCMMDYFELGWLQAKRI